MDASAGLIIMAVLAGLLCLRRHRCGDQRRSQTAATFIGIVLFALVIITSFATCADIKLEWNPNPETNIASYEVKAAEVWGMHEVTQRTTTTAATITGLKAGVPYLFCVRAENSVGLLSPYSDSITGIPLPRYKLTIQKGSNAIAVAPPTQDSTEAPR